jgi:hypothetical protein
VRADDTEMQPTTTRRVVYREIREADRRKFMAQSNDAVTGGGARDIRFGPYSKFGDVFARMFPTQRVVKRKANAATTVFVGSFSWNEQGAVRQMESVFEPPTLSRRSEGRIPTVHKYPCFENLPGMDEGMVLMILVQDADDTVWPSFITEATMDDPRFDRAMASKLKGCIAAARASKTAVCGFIDFETGTEFCNGR